MMEKRVGIKLDEAQIERACESFVTARLLPDEEASASLINGMGEGITCVIEIRKKRVRKKNGGQP